MKNNYIIKGNNYITNEIIEHVHNKMKIEIKFNNIIKLNK